MLQEPRVEGRHAHQHRRARRHGQDLAGVEPGQEKQRTAADEQHVDGHEQSVHVIDRQGVDQHVLLREAPGVDQRPGVGRQVGVGQHRPLGPAGGAGGVDDGGEIIVRAGDRLELRRLDCSQFGERALARLVEGLDPRAREAGDFLHALARLGIADDQPRLGVPDEVADLRERIGRVEGQIDRPRPQRRQVEHEVAGRLLHLHGDPFAGLDAGPNQGVGHPPGLGDEGLIGKLSSVRGLERQPVGRRLIRQAEVEEIAHDKGL